MRGAPPRDGLRPAQPLDGAILRRAGVMAVVAESGTVHPSEGIAVLLPTGPHAALDPV